MALNAERDHPAHIQAAINAQKLKCQFCGKPLVDGVHVSVHVEPGTFEQLRAWGYPVPGRSGISS